MQELENKKVTGKIFMLLVRCFSCGKVIAASFDEFTQRTEAGEDPGDVLDDLGITKYCCRRMFISHVDVW